MQFKKTLVFLLFLFMGIFLGTVLTEIASKVEFLSFLTWGKTIGVGTPHPVVVDLSVFTLTFGFTFQLNLAILISIIGCLLLYQKVGKGI